MAREPNSSDSSVPSLCCTALRTPMPTEVCLSHAETCQRHMSCNGLTSALLRSAETQVLICKSTHLQQAGELGVPEGHMRGAGVCARVDAHAQRR